MLTAFYWLHVEARLVASDMRSLARLEILDETLMMGILVGRVESSSAAITQLPHFENDTLIFFCKLNSYSYNLCWLDFLM